MSSMYMSAQEKSLTWSAPPEPSTIDLSPLGEPLIFLSAELMDETKLEGPLATTLFISSSTTDADLFATLQAFPPDARQPEVLAQGTLRASNRNLDLFRSEQPAPLTPGTVVELRIAMSPARGNTVVPAGYRLGLRIAGHDGSGAAFPRGAEVDRPKEVFGGKTTIYTGGDRTNFVTLPIVGDAAWGSQKAERDQIRKLSSSGVESLGLVSDRFPQGGILVK